MVVSKKLQKGIAIKIHTVAIFSTILLGAYLRFYKIREYMTFLGDEGRDVLIVKRMLVTHDITFLGPTASVGGFFLGPIYYYFMTPFLWVYGLDPVGPAVMVAAVGVMTIGLLYIVGAKWYDKNAGLVAAALYAISPLVIAHARSSWNPNIVPFFSLLYIYALYEMVRTKNWWWYMCAGACLGIGIQLHYLFLFLIPIGVVYVLLYDRRLLVDLRRVAYGVGGALFFLTPFLAFEIKNRFPNTRTIINFIHAGNEVSVGGNPVDTIREVIFRLFARLVFFYPPPEQLSINTFDATWWWRAAIIAVIIGSLGLLGTHIYYKRQKSDVLLALWLIFCVGLFIFYQRAIYDYYFVIMFAVPFLIIGMVCASLMQKYWGMVIVIVGIGYLLMFNWTGRPFVHTPNNQIGQVERIAHEVFITTNGMPYNFALITSGNSDHAYRFFLESWGDPPITIVNEHVDPTRSTITEQLIVLCEFATCEPLGHPLWEIAGFGSADIASEKDIDLGMKVYRLVHHKE